MIRPVILSGGAGTRLWPLSRPGRPKQLLALAGELTLLQQTALRLSGQGLTSAPIVVAGEADGTQVSSQLEAAGVAPIAIILEPAARNTAAAIALAALAADPGEILLVMPSDHLIADENALGEAVRRARPAAEEGWLATFGIVPASPHTGYGYVRRGEAIQAGVFAAAAFEEKPNLERAEAFAASGEHYWNSGLFLFKAEAILEALGRHAPDVLAAARAAFEAAAREGALLRPQAFAFGRSPSISIDYAVMEKAERVALVPVDPGWSDIGSWDSLYALKEKDEGGNAVAGEVVAHDARGCLILSDGPAVAALGVEDLVIVATKEAVLVARRGRTEEVKAIVEGLKARGR